MSIKYAVHKSSTKNRVVCERVEENLGIIEGDPIQVSRINQLKQRKRIKLNALRQDQAILHQENMNKQWPSKLILFLTS